MAKLKASWVKTDIPKKIKIKLWSAMRETSTHKAWEEYIAEHPDLFEAAEKQKHLVMSRDTYKRLQSEIREMPPHEVQSLPKELQQWIKDVRPVLTSDSVSPKEEVKSYKSEQHPLLNKRLEQHWDALADIAAQVAAEIQLPLAASFNTRTNLIPTYSPLGVDVDEVDTIEFTDSLVKWSFYRGKVILGVERSSETLWNGLMAHLEAEDTDFKHNFEEWRQLCTRYVRSWQKYFQDNFRCSKEYGLLIFKEMSLLNTLDLVVYRRTFEGKCEICQKW